MLGCGRIGSGVLAGRGVGTILVVMRALAWAAA